jgi:hypothetical protein
MRTVIGLLIFLAVENLLIYYTLYRIRQELSKG